MTAWIIIRAEVPEADRAAFDRWYEDEHLPEAKAAFRALSAWRGWSDVTAGLTGDGTAGVTGGGAGGVHVAAYEMTDLAHARAVVASEEMAAMRAEFDRVWQDRVRRVREVVEVAQSL